MNSIGNRQTPNNIRLMVVNNGLGGEFKTPFINVQRAGLGNSANKYIAAEGHYGHKSKELLKHYAEDLGFDYISASNKNEFDLNYKRFWMSRFLNRWYLRYLLMNIMILMH